MDACTGARQTAEGHRQGAKLSKTHKIVHYVCNALPPPPSPSLSSSLSPSLSLSLSQYLTAVELWCTEESEREWEPADSVVEAQQQLDSIQGQYDQLLNTHSSLIERYACTINVCA